MPCAGRSGAGPDGAADRPAWSRPVWTPRPTCMTCVTRTASPAERSASFALYRPAGRHAHALRGLSPANNKPDPSSSRSGAIGDKRGRMVAAFRCSGQMANDGSQRDTFYGCRPVLDAAGDQPLPRESDCLGAVVEDGDSAPYAHGLVDPLPGGTARPFGFAVDQGIQRDSTDSGLQRLERDPREMRIECGQAKRLAEYRRQPPGRTASD